MYDYDAIDLYLVHDYLAKGGAYIINNLAKGGELRVSGMGKSLIWRVN